ncbi:MAG: hypothetical protein ABIB71_02750 [Candidatus Woesearchaeota archaeon]
MILGNILAAGILSLFPVQGNGLQPLEERVEKSFLGWTEELKLKEARTETSCLLGEDLFGNRNKLSAADSLVPSNEMFRYKITSHYPLYDVFNREQMLDPSLKRMLADPMKNQNYLIDEADKYHWGGLRAERKMLKGGYLLLVLGSAAELFMRLDEASYYIKKFCGGNAKRPSPGLKFWVHSDGEEATANLKYEWY